MRACVYDENEGYGRAQHTSTRSRAIHQKGPTTSGRNDRSPRPAENQYSPGRRPRPRPSAGPPRGGWLCVRRRSPPLSAARPALGWTSLSGRAGGAGATPDPECRPDGAVLPRPFCPPGTPRRPPSPPHAVYACRVAVRRVPVDADVVVRRGRTSTARQSPRRDLIERGKPAAPGNGRGNSAPGSRSTRTFVCFSGHPRPSPRSDGVTPVPFFRELSAVRRGVHVANASDINGSSVEVRSRLSVRVSRRHGDFHRGRVDRERDEGRVVGRVALVGGRTYRVRVYTRYRTKARRATSFEKTKRRRRGRETGFGQKRRVPTRDVRLSSTTRRRRRLRRT